MHPYLLEPTLLWCVRLWPSVSLLIQHYDLILYRCVYMHTHPHHTV